MKAGIVGLPNVGKSTLFNCLSNTKAQSANFPFCTIEPNHSIINVPDKRLITLQEIVNPEKLIPATVEIVDIAGLVKGASKGEGLGNKFLANIRETDAIIHVLRCFDNDNITHVDGSVDPIRDKEIIDIELQLKDLESLNNRLEKVSRTVKSGDKEAAREKEVLNQAISFIDCLLTSGNNFEVKINKEIKKKYKKHFIEICNSYQSRNIKYYNKTLKCMEDGIPIIYQAVLYNYENKTFGPPKPPNIAKTKLLELQKLQTS